MDKLLLEYPWLPKVVSLSKDHGLDWLMMSCLALELSGGDPRCRTLDREFMLEHMGPDCPLVAAHWESGLPDTHVQDLCTRWGLFQILGRVAQDQQLFTGRLYNFADIGANVRAACLIAQRIINEGGTIDDIMLYLGANPDRVKELMAESRHSVTMLLNITPMAEEDENES